MKLRTYLTPNVDCRRVVNPDTKNIVFNTLLMMIGLSAKHRGTERTNGIPNVAPNIVR